jgi:ATP-dependent DNA helicase RecG
MSVREVKGIGEKTEQLFAKLGVYTVYDLVHFYPRSYEIYKKPTLINEIYDNSVAVIYGVIVMSPEFRRAR